MLSFSNTIADKDEEEGKDVQRQDEKKRSSECRRRRHPRDVNSPLLSDDALVLLGRKRYAKLIDICITLLHALNALLYARKKHKQIMFSFSTAVKPSTALFSHPRRRKRNERETHRFMATVDGEKRAQRKVRPWLLSALARTGRNPTDDYNKWKAELMEKKRKVQEEAAKKPKKPVCFNTNVLLHV